MTKLTETVLRRPVSVIVIVAALIIFGTQSVLGMNLQLIPDMDLPVQLIMCTFPGASPEDVEKLVTKPIEDGCATISGVDTVASYSMENTGLVMLSFDYGTNMDKAFIDIMQSMEIVKASLPDDARDPMVIAMDINATPVVTLSIETEKEGLDPLSYVDDKVEPELQKIVEVAQVDKYGGKKEYISVELVPELLAQYKLNINSVAQAVKDANFVIPVGTADYGGQRINASSTSEYKTPEQLRTIPITTPGGDVIHLSDVARVDYAREKITSYSRYNGGDNVSVSITKTQNGSAVRLADKISKLVDKLNEENQDYKITVSYSSAKSILSSLKTIGQTLVLGIVITMVVLLLFFGDIKGSLIVASSMPVSVLGALILMSFMGFSLNMMTMGALVIAIGMMVDNSIVVIEMCFTKQEEGLDFFDAALEGTSIVMSSIIASTITTIVVYLPMALMEGLSGQLFGQLGYTIVFALVASLISAITLVPLCFYVYRPTEKKGNRVTAFLERVGERYGNVLQWALHHKKITALTAVAIFAVSIVMCRFINMELMPSSDEGQVNINLAFRPGTKADIINEKVKEIEDFVKDSPYVENYSATAGGGSGFMSAMSSGSGSGSVRAYLKDDIRSKPVVDEWTPLVQKYAENCTITVDSGSSMMSMGGSGGSYDVRLKGNDLAVLKDTAARVAQNLGGINGVISVSSSLANAASRADIISDPIKAMAAGISPKAVAGTVYTTLNGSDAFDVKINDKDYTVTVELPRDDYQEINDIRSIMLKSNTGDDVPLSDVADIVFTDSPKTITKSDREYIATVSCTIDGRVKFETQKAVDNAVKAMYFPTGVRFTENSMQESMNEEFSKFAGAIVTAIILVYMVMAIQFNNLRYSGVVMFCIPFSLIGSIALLLVTRATLNMTSLMGFLMLIGIVVNNGIIFVDYTNMLRAEGESTIDALVETGRSRLRPILMTTLTTVLSMIPMGLGIGRNGQMTQGMAMVIIGGLVASTILTLVLLPTFYLIVHNRSKAFAQRKLNRVKK